MELSRRKINISFTKKVKKAITNNKKLTLHTFLKEKEKILKTIVFELKQIETNKVFNNFLLKEVKDLTQEQKDLIIEQLEIMNKYEEVLYKRQKELKGNN